MAELVAKRKSPQRKSLEKDKPPKKNPGEGKASKEKAGRRKSRQRKSLEKEKSPKEKPGEGKVPKKKPGDADEVIKAKSLPTRGQDCKPQAFQICAGVQPNKLSWLSSAE